jgi:hypothetical protein
MTYYDTNQKKGNVTSKMEMTSFLFSLVILFGLFGLQFLYEFESYWFMSD